MKILGTITQVIGGVIILIPLFQWMRHPELTQMEIFLTYWWVELFGIAIIIVGALIHKNKD